MEIFFLVRFISLSQGWRDRGKQDRNIPLLFLPRRRRRRRRVEKPKIYIFIQKVKLQVFPRSG